MRAESLLDLKSNCFTGTNHEDPCQKRDRCGHHEEKSVHRSGRSTRATHSPHIARIALTVPRALKVGSEWLPAVSWGYSKSKGIRPKVSRLAGAAWAAGRDAGVVASDGQTNAAEAPVAPDGKQVHSKVGEASAFGRGGALR